MTKLQSCFTSPQLSSDRLFVSWLGACQLGSGGFAVCCFQITPLFLSCVAGTRPSTQWLRHRRQAREKSGGQISVPLLTDKHRAVPGRWVGRHPWRAERAGNSVLQGIGAGGEEEEQWREQQHLLHHLQPLQGGHHLQLQQELQPGHGLRLLW